MNTDMNIWKVTIDGDVYYYIVATDIDDAMRSAVSNKLWKDADTIGTCVKVTIEFIGDVSAVGK